MGWQLQRWYVLQVDQVWSQLEAARRSEEHERPAEQDFMLEDGSLLQLSASALQVNLVPGTDICIGSGCKAWSSPHTLLHISSSACCPWKLHAHALPLQLTTSQSAPDRLSLCPLTCCGVSGNCGCAGPHLPAGWLL